MRGHKAIGFDADPLAVLMARVWCADVNEAAIKKQAGEVLGRANDRYRGLKLGEAYPEDADAETQDFIRFWFDERNRKQLAALAESISRVRDSAVREILWCAFSRLIITKQAGASLAMDVSHSRPHRAFEKAPIEPLDRFIRSVETVLKAAPFKDAHGAAKAMVRRADARRLPLPNSSVDLVTTSPPYLNAIDYLRGHRLSLVWMGYSVKQIRGIRSASVGTESSKNPTYREAYVEAALEQMGKVQQLPNRLQRMLGQYMADMNMVLGELHRVLRSGGRAVLVVGDSYLRGVYVQNSRAIAYLGSRSGFRLQSMARRELPQDRRYLPPPNSTASGTQLRARMREEVIIKFHKKQC